MYITTKHFYENGEEMNSGDLVYLEGTSLPYGLEFSGIFELANVDEATLTVYFLGQNKEPYQSINIEKDSITALLPITNYGLIEEIEEIRKEVFDKIKNRN